MNTTLDLLQTIHQFVLLQINHLQRHNEMRSLKAANQTSSFSLQVVLSLELQIQSYEKVMQLSVNQPYIEEAAEFWILCRF